LWYPLYNLFLQIHLSRNSNNAISYINFSYLQNDALITSQKEKYDALQGATKNIPMFLLPFSKQSLDFEVKFYMFITCLQLRTVTVPKGISLSVTITKLLIIFFCKHIGTHTQFAERKAHCICAAEKHSNNIINN